MVRQGDLLERLEPGPILTPAMRQAAMPLVAALLLEAAANLTQEMASVTATDREADDEQDRV